MAATQQPIISCQGVWKVFGPESQRVVDMVGSGESKASVQTESGHVIAVRDVSFGIYPGETFVVMGLSGSGKSTLLRCLPRLIEPTRGKILIDGQDVVTLDDKSLRGLRRHSMSMVFQHFGLFSHRRVLDNVAYGLEIQGVKKAERYAKARAVLEMVNLQGWEDHYPEQLSGGMQQRVGLARALAVDPAILLFDEPFSALDPLIRREMQDELLYLQRQMHRTLLFITHDFAEAIRLGDRIAIMKDGEFVQVGSAEEVVLHPATAYVAEFTSDVPRSKVLTARAIMDPVGGELSSGDAVPATMVLDELIPILAERDAKVPVVDHEQQVVGCIDRATLLLALGQPRPDRGEAGIRAEGTE